MKCVYPGCRTSVEEENSWCADHAEVTCLYPLFEPLCQERPVPNSNYCTEHNKVTGFIKTLHNALHQQAAAQVQAMKQQQAVIERAAAHLKNGHN